MRRRALIPIRHSSGQEHERALTQTIRVTSATAVPAEYRRIPIKSPAIYAKVQVLSCQRAQPVFVETVSPTSERRVAYWVHPDILPELARWLRARVFPLSDLIDDDAS